MAAALAFPVFAGSPHYVSLSGELDGNTIVVDFKIAGLGDVEQIFVEVTAEAACVNPGSNKPKAGNKQSVSAGADLPVQNGRADTSISGPIELTATFSPDCTPPMTVEFSNVQITVYGTTATGEQDVNDVLIKATTVPL
jgi:hypothetical protein